MVTKNRKFADFEESSELENESVLDNEEEISEKLLELETKIDDIEPIHIVPDGSYSTHLFECDIFKNKKDKLMFTAKFKITEGKLKNRQIAKFYDIDSESEGVGIAYFKSFAEMIGFQIPKKLSTLKSLFNKYVNENSINLIIAMKGGYIQTFIGFIEDTEE